ncbi:MAG: FKBP-type peptidyl-prolyl cis-trans isomerase [Bacteroidales bacterium]|nr:FKBP-type peptidyl-prolyl cis-trans isomerase [Candidatus Physcousia equi]
MKKITMMMAACAALVMSSCGGSSKTPSAELKNGVDTLCYAYGVAQSRGFLDYAYSERGLGIDSTSQEDFIKGIIDGANLGSSASKNAYYAGIAIGQQLMNSVSKGLTYEIFGNDSTGQANLNDFLAGFIANVKGEKVIISADSVDNYIRTKMMEVKAKQMEQEFGEYKKQNIEYLANIAKQDSIQKLESGVYYKVITAGNGEIPTADARVKVNYEGKTIDGNVFDSSLVPGREPLEIRCTDVIKGWTDALTHMPVGSKWILYIPAEAAYGAQNQGPIKPFSTLIFTVELLEILK